MVLKRRLLVSGHKKARDPGLPDTRAQGCHQGARLLLIFSFAKLSFWLASSMLQNGSCVYMPCVSKADPKQEERTELSPRETSFVREGTPQGRLPTFCCDAPFAARLGDYFSLPDSVMGKGRQNALNVSGSHPQGLQHMLCLFEAV